MTGQQQSTHDASQPAPQTEQSPLLGDSPQPASGPSKSFQRRVLLTCIVFLFTVGVSQSIAEPPLQQIMEDIICRDYYPDHVLRAPHDHDWRCKSTQVQKTLAMVRGWTLAADTAIPIVSQFPFGIMADKYGRKPVFFLSFLGFTLSFLWRVIVLLLPDTFSVWAMPVGSAFLVIGGGGPMITAMIWTILSDAIPPADRSVIFSRLGAFTVGMGIAVKPISAALLSLDPWIALWLGFAFVCVAMLCTLVVPETVHLQQKSDDMAQGVEAPRDEHPGPAKHGYFKFAWNTIKHDINHVWKFIFASKTILVLVFALALFDTIIASSAITLQYATKRFDWEWSKALYVETVGMVAAIFCLVGIIPVASNLVTKRYRASPMERDLSLARWSIVTFAFGYFLMGIGGEPWLFMVSLIVIGFGSGFGILCRALLNTLVEPHTVATLSTTISLIFMVMGIIGGPAAGWLLSRGIEMGGIWMGLPFVTMSAITAGITIGVFCFKIPRSST